MESSIDHLFSHDQAEQDRNTILRAIHINSDTGSQMTVGEVILTLVLMDTQYIKTYITPTI
jgi:hypothetical protein